MGDQHHDGQLHGRARPGSGRAARHGGRLRNPLKAYAALEAIVAASGLSLVLAFPFLVAVLAPVLRLFLDAPLVLNAARMGLAFLLLLVPATAMGATPPVVRHGTRSAGTRASAGRWAGSTAGIPCGAVAGTLLVETVGSSTGLACAALRWSRPSAMRGGDGRHLAAVHGSRSTSGRSFRRE